MSGIPIFRRRPPRKALGCAAAALALLLGAPAAFAQTATLAASDVEDDTATLTLTNHSGDWYYKYTVPSSPAGTCSTVVSSGTDTASLTNLSTGTSYTFKAYSNNDCSTELTTDATDAEFLTKPGQVTGVAASAAKGSLTVGWTAATGATGYTIQWKKSEQQFDSSRQATPTGNSHKITGLTDGTAYTIRVRASNGTGDGDWSAEATGTPAATVVPSPDLSVTGGTRQLTATWVHPLPGTGGLTFRVRYRKAGTSTWSYADASSNSGHQNFPNNATSTTIPGHEGGTLDDNASYEVSVRAGKWNQGYSGWGPWSGTESAPTLPGAPTKPTLTVANLGGGKVRVAASVTGGATLTRWDYKKKGSGGYDAEWTEIASTSSSLSHTVSGLTNGTAYKFKVRAVNASGAGAESAESEAATPAAATLAASSVEDDTATLTITGHSGDWYHKYTVPSSPAGTCSTVMSSGTDTASLASLTTATSYTWKAYSDNQCNTELTSASTDAEFLTKPGQVTGVSAASGNTSLSVSWTALTGTVTGYKVQWKSSGQNYTSARTNTVTGGSSTTGTITGLTNNTQYTVRVTAYNNTGDGDASSEVTGTPAVPVVTLAASNVEDDTATLTLTNHVGDWYYKYTVPSSPAGTCSTVVSSGTYTASLASLVTGTSYTFKAYSDNQCNTELTTDASDAEFLTKPGQVTGVNVQSGNTSLAVRWTALSGTVTGYKVQWKTQGQSYDTTRQKTVTSGASTTITGLNNGTYYNVRVTAYNTTGDGTPSSDSNQTPKAPYLDFASTVPDQSYTVGSAVAVTLPAGVAKGTCTAIFYYHLTPDLPAGLSFNASTRVISGTPTAPAATTEYTYIGYDDSCYETAAQTFDVTVAAAAGVRLSKSAVSLTEGGAGQTYTVRLNTAPASDVTVAVASGDGGAVTASSASLTFTSSNYDSTQTVTLTAVQDADGADETVTVTHTASGGLTATATLTANVTDDDKGITLSPTSLDVPEGTSGTYTVALAAAPSSNVSVDVNTQHLIGISRSPSSLTFTTSNWNAPQTVTVTPADNQGFEGNRTVAIRHITTGGGYGTVTANLSVFVEDDENPGLVVSPATLALTEGGNAGTFTVRMGGTIAIGETATVSVTSGDGGAATVSPASLTFQRHNATTNQTVTVTPVQDADNDDESVTVTMTASGAGYDRETGTVTVSVSDDETKLTVSAITHESATLTLVNSTSDWYWKQTSPSAGQCSSQAVSSGSSASLTGLAGGTTHTYKAYSDSGCSIELAAKSFITTPPKVTGVAAAPGSDAGAVDVSWTAATGATSYKVQWKTSSQQWDSTNRELVSTTTSAMISNLTAGTEYTVRVAAGNTSGDGPWSDTATGTAATGGVTPSTTSLSVPEGGSATYTLVLDTSPSHAVTIAVAKQSGGDADLTVSPASLSFSTTNWSSPQTVTVTAKQDSDTAGGTATITHTATSSDSGYNGVTIAGVTATEADDDAHGVVVSETAVSVPEGGSAVWTVRLASVPSATVYVDMAKQSGGDADLTFSPAQLTFTTRGWDLPQTVTVSAAQDTDAARGTATITHTATSTDTSYGSSLAIASVTATEDDDELGVTVSKKAVSVPEGGSATWTVVLDGPPTANVTIAVAKKTGGDGNLTASPASLTFTSTNWSSAQTVTASAAQDSDETDGTATFTHTATSTDTDFNGLAIASVAATEDDDDAPGVTLSKASVSVTEGSTATYTVVLDTAPTHNVTIAVAKQSGGDADLTVSPASLTFTSTNWNQAQTVTVTAAEDDTDDANGTATFTHTASSTDTDYGSSLTIASVTATEADNDTLAGVTVSKTSVSVTEGSTATYTVVLDTAPSANVTIAVAKQSGGDADLTVSPASLTFTSTNYATAQTVTVTAAEDADDADGTATITHTATSTDASYGGIAIASVAATEADTAPASADLTLTVSRDNRTAIPLRDLPFTGEGGATLHGVKIVSLPGASDGTLGLVKTGIYAGAATVLCVGTITPLTAGQVVVDAVSTVLYFCPKDGFNRTTFRFQVVDSQGRTSGAPRTATLVGPPGQVTGVAAEAGNGYVRLSWTDPQNPAITGYEYRQRSGAGVTTWGAWQAMTGSGAATTSHSVSGLTNGTAYTFQVRAKSAGGAGPIPSAEVVATPTSGVVPAQPTGLQLINLGFNSAQTYVKVGLFWDDPVDPSITRYEVEQNFNNLGWQRPINAGWSGANNHVPGSGATTTSVKFDVGSHESRYTFRVRAVNAAGNGAWRETERDPLLGNNSIELNGDAERPVLASVEPGNGKVRLRWTHSGSNLKNHGGYWGYRTGSTDTSLTSTQAGTAARSYVVGSLTNGSSYTYQVFSWGSVEADDPDNRHPVYSNSRTLTLPAAPAKPAGLTAKGAPSGAALSWTDPKNAALTGWQYRQKAGVGAYGSWTRVPGSTAGTTSASLSGLTDGTEHKFQVRAVIEYEAALGGTLAGAASDEVSVTPVGVVVSKDRLALAEGGAAGSYTVKLSQAPTHNVTITVSVDGDGTVTADTDDVATGNQTTLTFSTTNYATARTVKVKAAEDDDGRHSTATITHTASSTDARYGNLVGIPGLTAAVTDNDAGNLGITLSKASVTLTEGSTATYTVVLDVKPSSAVTVTIARASGANSKLAIVDTDPGTTGTQTTLTFSTTNYAGARTVTVSAAEDDNDVVDGTATFTHTAAGGGYGNVAAATLAAAETDNDTGIVLTPATLSVPEEGSATYTVALGTQPGANVTVAIARASGGDEDLTVSPSSLTFTATNHSSAQTVTVSAADDVDEVNGTATFTHTASGAGSGYAGDSASLAATEADNERRVELSASAVSLTEGGSTGSYTVTLASAPDANVTVAVSSDDTGAVTTSPASLTFTTTNYSSAQTVTLTAVGDADGADESVTVSNTASGGGYDASADATVSVDDDDQGVTVAGSPVALTEGGSTGSYTVRLAAAPNADVTVAVSSDDTGAVTASPSSLTFTTTNYSSVQTVTLTAVGDADGADESVTVSNTSSGGGYDASADATATVDDDDQGLTLSVSTVALTEGGSTGSYTVRLAAAPNADVTVAVSSDDTGAVTASPSSLTFTTTNWASVQTVTLTAVEDGDGTDESVTVSNTASGGGYDVSGDVTATVDDDDQGLDLSASAVALTEGGSTGSYTVALSAAPDANVTVTVSSDDTGAVRASPSSLTFSTTNYSTARTVTLTTVGDGDGADESVTVSNTASGGGYDTSGDVTVTVDDDDQGLTLSASTVSLTEGGSTGSYTVKLNAAPNADVTVAVSSDDTGAVTVSPSSLTFTTTNYASTQTVTLTVVNDDDGADESVTVSNTSSGGGYDASADVTATVDDDDQGLTLSVSTVALTEGGATGSYTVKLNAAPNADVTVAVSSDDTGAVTASPTSLTFTTTNWASVQTVTLTAVEDGDGTDESVTVSNTASGGGYTVSGNVTATVDDDDQGLDLSASTVALTEGGSTGSYTVALSAAPDANVTVAVSSDDTGAVRASPSSLTFSTTNYSTARTVTLTPVGDADGADESVTVSNSASGGGYDTSGDVTATVDDDDQGLTLSVSTVALTEGGSTGSYTVKLNAAPNADVTVAVASDDTDAVTASPSSLTFTTTNYASTQTVTLTVVNDDDGADESVTVSNSASGGGYDTSGDVTVTVDDDEQGLTLSVSTVALTEGGSTGSYTVKLNAAPNADVTVAVSSDDTGAVTVSPSSLTFTTTNYASVQTVTLTAVEEEDGADESVTVSNTASGGGYTASGDVTVAVDDDDQGLTLSVSDVLSLAEGSTETYTVALAAAPSADVTVAVSSGDTGAVTASPASLTFSTTNYSTARTVTLTAVNDADGADESVTVSNAATGGGYTVSGDVTATVDDDDQGLTLSASTVSVTEGSTATYTVRLAAAPNADVTVAVSSDDTGAVTVSPSSLTFTTTNYSSTQTVTLTTVNDDDGADESVTVSNTSSGGGYDASAGVTATVDDDDQGLTLSASSVSVTEGSTATYTVRLAAAPSADVTVAVSSGDTGAVTVSPSSLTFTTTNHASVQTVTLTAVEDTDGADESVTVSNTASGGGYTVSAGVTAAVDDDDQGLTLSVASVKVAEGGTQTYTVKLAAQPSGTVTVAIAKAAGGDADLTVNRSTLRFGTSNYAGAQTVTVRAAEETGEDSANGTATFTHTASGGGYAVSADLAAKELDNDRVVGIPATLRVPEGGTATYTVKLAVAPSADVTLTLAVSGDSDLTVDADDGAQGAQDTVTFSDSNYATARTVTVAAAQDGDFADGAATISHAAASSDADYDAIPIPGVRATEADDDTPPPISVAGVTLSSSNVTVPEGATATYTVALATRPDAAVTVTLTRAPGGDADLTVDTDPGTPGAQRTLTFTPARWNVAQTVTVTAALDDDSLDGTATFTHTAAGGGYDGVSATLTAVEADDNRRFVLSTSGLAVPEGGVATYTVKLAGQPSDDVTVTLTRSPGGDPDLSVDTDPDTAGAQRTLVFTPADFGDARTVTVNAAADADGVDGTATFTHTAAGGGYGGVSATLAAVEADDDRRIVLSPSRLTVPEGLTATYEVALASRPSRAVTVTLARDAGGDADLTVDTDPDTADAQRTLVFTPADWSDARTVTVAAAVDADEVDGTATFTHTAAGGIWTGVTATLAVVEEDEPAPVVVGALPALILVPGGAPRTVDVSGAFRGSNLSYAVHSSREASVTASIEGAVVTLTPLREGEARITVTARNRIGEARQSFTATVGADPAERRAVEDGLAAIGRGMLSSIDMVLGARLRGESSEGVRIAGYALESGDIEAAPYAAQGFPPDAGHEPPGHGREEESADVDWLDGTSSFVVALNAGADAGEGADLAFRWTLWGQGYLQSFESSRSSVDGETRTAWLGLDTALGDDWLLGTAVSYGEGHADYAFEGESGSGSGRLRTTLTSLHPYLRWRPWEDGTVWVALGVGSGEVENRRDHLGRVERGDLSMFTAWGGGRYALHPAAGGVELALLGDLAFLRMHTDAEAAQGSLGDVSSTVDRLRVGVEGSYEIRMEAGTLSPFGQVSTRYDGGDGETGSGMEVSGGVRYHRGRMSFETGARMLWAGAGDYEESGWNVALALEPREAGRGLSMSLSPTWGAAQHRALEALWRPDALSVLDDGAAPEGGDGMRTSIGYGLRWPASAALLTPYAEHDSFSSGDRRTSMGVRLEHRPSRLEVDLRGELEEGPNREAGDTGVFLEVGLRF